MRIKNEGMPVLEDNTKVKQRQSQLLSKNLSVWISDRHNRRSIPEESAFRRAEKSHFRNSESK